MKSVECRKCKARIVFLRTEKNRMTPVDANTVSPGDIKFDRSRHISHFATCPNAAEFRGKKLGAK